MTDEQINIAIAESLGWTNCRLVIKGAGGGTRYPTAHGMPPNRKYESSCPNYTSDLNACHECVRSLTYEQRTTYREHLSKIWTRDYNSRCGLFPRHDDSVNATARQRCEAYLKTIGKWIE